MSDADREIVYRLTPVVGSEWDAASEKISGIAEHLKQVLDEKLGGGIANGFSNGYKNGTAGIKNAVGETLKDSVAINGSAKAGEANGHAYANGFSNVAARGRSAAFSKNRIAGFAGAASSSDFDQKQIAAAQRDIAHLQNMADLQQQINDSKDDDRKKAQVERDKEKHDREQAVARTRGSAELNRLVKSGPQAVAQDEKKLAAAEAKAERMAVRVEHSQERMTHAMIGGVRGVLEFAKGLAELGIAGRETTEEILQGILKIDGGFRLVASGIETYEKLNKAVKLYELSVKQAAAAEKSLAAWRALSSKAGGLGTATSAAGAAASAAHAVEGTSGAVSLARMLGRMAGGINPVVLKLGALAGAATAGVVALGALKTAIDSARESARRTKEADDDYTLGKRHDHDPRESREAYIRREAGKSMSVADAEESYDRGRRHYAGEGRDTYVFTERAFKSDQGDTSASYGSTAHDLVHGGGYLTRLVLKPLLDTSDKLSGQHPTDLNYKTDEQLAASHEARVKRADAERDRRERDRHERNVRQSKEDADRREAYDELSGKLEFRNRLSAASRPLVDPGADELKKFTFDSRNTLAELRAEQDRLKQSLALKQAQMIEVAAEAAKGPNGEAASEEAVERQKQYRLEIIQLDRQHQLSVQAAGRQEQIMVRETRRIAIEGLTKQLNLQKQALDANKSAAQAAQEIYKGGLRGLVNMTPGQLRRIAGLQQKAKDRLPFNKHEIELAQQSGIRSLQEYAERQSEQQGIALAKKFGIDLSTEKNAAHAARKKQVADEGEENRLNAGISGAREAAGLADPDERLSRQKQAEFLEAAKAGNSPKPKPDVWFPPNVTSNSPREAEAMRKQREAMEAKYGSSSPAASKQIEIKASGKIEVSLKQAELQAAISKHDQEMKAFVEKQFDDFIDKELPKRIEQKVRADLQRMQQQRRGKGL